MEYSDYQTQQQESPKELPQQPPQQQTTASRGRGRRQYAAQQYDFNVPTAPPVYDQQSQYPLQQSQTQPPAQYGQPPDHTQQQGYHYGQEYQQTSPHLYQQGFQGQTGVSGMTNQFQQMHVSQVCPRSFMLC